MKESAKDRLWTKDFLILWQGQLVSTLGDAAYSIALGFWVLQVTGSTALMGLLQASSTLPGILISPFTGVIIDRVNRKRLLIAMDLLRGAAIVTISIAAFQGWLQIWMVFAAGVVLSLCGAAFRPGVLAVMPELVSREKLTNANSVFSVVGTGATMLGNVSGGYLLQLLGAPVLFIFNGLSYLFSGISILFMRIPRQEKRENQSDFFADMREGFAYIWKEKGLRYALIMAAVCNFFTFIAITLLLPLFQKTPELGAGRYGLAIACFMGGAMIGFVVFSILSIPTRRKHVLVTASLIGSNLLLIAAVNVGGFAPMLALITVGGFLNSIVNVIFQSSIQGAAPSELRGKVMAFMSMTTQGLTPLAMALGGVLGGIFPIRSVISMSFLMALVICLPFLFMKAFDSFLTSEPAEPAPAPHA